MAARRSAPGRPCARQEAAAKQRCSERAAPAASRPATLRAPCMCASQARQRTCSREGLDRSTACSAACLQAGGHSDETPSVHAAVFIKRSEEGRGVAAPCSNPAAVRPLDAARPCLASRQSVAVCGQIQGMKSRAARPPVAQQAHGTRCRRRLDVRGSRARPAVQPSPQIHAQPTQRQPATLHLHVQQVPASPAVAPGLPHSASVSAAGRHVLHWQRACHAGAFLSLCRDQQGSATV